MRCFFGFHNSVICRILNTYTVKIHYFLIISKTARGLNRDSFFLVSQNNFRMSKLIYKYTEKSTVYFLNKAMLRVSRECFEFLIKKNR
jgi:hypothetical protein